MRNKKITRLLRLVFLIAALLAAAYLGMHFMGRKHAADHVLTQPVTQGAIEEKVSAIGALNPIEVITVGAQVTGKVTGMHAQVNQRVVKNEVLAEIDPVLLQSQLKQSEAAYRLAADSLELAKKNYERLQKLLKADYISQSDLEQAELNYKNATNNAESARAHLESDKANLSYTTILSPVDGVVISQEVTEGQTVSSGLQVPTLFKIAQDMRRMKIEISLPESDIGKVKVGQKVTFTVDAFSGRTFDGVISKVLLTPNPGQEVVTYTVNVEVDNSEMLLLPGMTAYVSIVVMQKDDVLRLPNSALRFVPHQPEVPAWQQVIGTNTVSAVPQPQPGKRMVYVIRAGALVPVEITPGVTDGKMTEVAAGDLQPQELVAVGYELTDE